jgi:hypothetical protein
MRFSRSVLAVAASQSRELFQAPVQPDLAPVLSNAGLVTYPAVYGAAAPLTQADFEGTYGATEYVVVEDQSSSGFFAPALVVVGLALAGYSYGRASSQSEEIAPVEDYDPSALELAGAFPADVAMLGLQGRESRREILAKASAALASVAAVQSASAKAGQFTKLEIFSVVGQPGISSPYQAGGPKAGADATFGYAKSDGPMLAKGYEADVTREKAGLEVSKKIVRAQGPNIDSKTWWLVRDNLRGQAYNMKANMRAINAVLEPSTKVAAVKAYEKFWKEIDQLDLACRTKEQALAQKEYQDVLEALKKYEEIIG